MRAFTNVNPRTLDEAVAQVKKASAQGQRAAIAGGGSDLLGMIKDHLVEPDVLVHLRSIQGLDQIRQEKNRVAIGGLTTIDSVANHPLIREKYAALSDAAGQVGTPQIRNAGTIAGNVSQRPWCWYYRNGFPCFKNGGKQCFSAAGENEFHAIFGGGPSFIVHPSDTAPALVALDATFRIVGPAGERTIPAADYFHLPKVDPTKENTPGEILAEIYLPAAAPGLRSLYRKVLDRESWTHAVVAVAVALQMDGPVCRGGRVVLGGVAPIPWRVPKVEAMLAGQKITPELAAKAGEIAVEGATPLAKNKYKVPLTKTTVKRALAAFGSAA
jgi:xanthine dehydrogenase YagS FAD-binding subunit